MIVTNTGQILEMKLYPSYKIESSDVVTFVKCASGVGAVLNTTEWIEQSGKLRNLLRTASGKDRELIEGYMMATNGLRAGVPFKLRYSHSQDGNKFEVFGDYEAQDIVINGNHFITARLFNIEEEPGPQWIQQQNYIYHIDIRRLLDWLAFDIGHLSYDPYLYSNDRISDYLGLVGQFITAEGDIVDRLVPENFAELLGSYCVDFNADTSYVRKDGVAYNYFRQESKAALKMRKIDGVNKHTSLGLKYEDLIYYQNNFVLMAYYQYLEQVAKALKLSIKLLGIGTGILDIYVTGRPDEEKLFTEVQEGIKVRLFDMLSFYYRPKVQRWVATRV